MRNDKVTETAPTEGGYGPTLQDPKPRDAAISAGQLAKMANVEAKDVLYWSRNGYLQRVVGSGVDDAEGKAFSLTQVPKTQLLGILTKRLRMNAGKASEVADGFLAKHAGREDSLEASIGAVEMLDRKFATLVDIILELDLVARFRKELENQP